MEETAVLTDMTEAALWHRDRIDTRATVALTVTTTLAATGEMYHLALADMSSMA